MKKKSAEAPSLWVIWGGWAVAGLLAILLVIVVVRSSGGGGASGFGRGQGPVSAAPAGTSPRPGPAQTSPGLTPSPGRLAPPQPGTDQASPFGGPSAATGRAFPGTPAVGYQATRPGPASPASPALTPTQEQEAIRNQGLAAVIARWSELRPRYYAAQAGLALALPSVTWDGGQRAEVRVSGWLTNVLAASQLTFRVLLGKYSAGWRADQVLVEGLPASPLAPSPAAPAAPATPPGAAAPAPAPTR